jgi:hypothetical protein
VNYNTSSRASFFILNFSASHFLLALPRFACPSFAFRTRDINECPRPVRSNGEVVQLDCRSASSRKQLRSLRQVRYVFAFAMNSREGQLNYHLVFASQHPLGLEKMNEAMKAVDKSGSYSFSDDTVGQELLFDFNAPAGWAAKMQLALGGSVRPYSEFHDYALNETPFINPKAMFKHLKDIGKLQINWRGQPGKTRFPEEKIAFILIVK